MNKECLIKYKTLLFKDRKMALENAIKDNNQIAIFDDGLTR